MVEQVEGKGLFPQPAQTGFNPGRQTGGQGVRQIRQVGEIGILQRCQAGGRARSRVIPHTAPAGAVRPEDVVFPFVTHHRDLLGGNANLGGKVVKELRLWFTRAQFGESEYAVQVLRQTYPLQGGAHLIRAGGLGIGAYVQGAAAVQGPEGCADAVHGLNLGPIGHRPVVLGEVDHEGVAPVKNQGARRKGRHVRLLGFGGGIVPSAFAMPPPF